MSGTLNSVYITGVVESSSSYFRIR